MKHLLTTLAIFVLVLSTVGFGQGEVELQSTEKIEVCHVNSANDIVTLGNFEFFQGRIIEISENALEAHLDHGDSTLFTPYNEATRDYLEQLLGIRLPNGNCFFLPQNQGQ